MIFIGKGVYNIMVYIILKEIHLNTVIRLFLVCFSGFYGRNVALVLLLLSLQVFTLFTVYLGVAGSSV